MAHSAAREDKIERVNVLKAAIAAAEQAGNREEAKATRSELRAYRQQWAIIREVHRQLRQGLKKEIQGFRNRIAEIEQQNP